MTAPLSRGEKEADRALIAAAPDLLAALEAALRAMVELGGCDDPAIAERQSIEACRLALARQPSPAQVEKDSPTQGDRK